MGVCEWIEFAQQKKSVKCDKLICWQSLKLKLWNYTSCIKLLKLNWFNFYKYNRLFSLKFLLCIESSELVLKQRTSKILRTIPLVFAFAYTGIALTLSSEKANYNQLFLSFFSLSFLFNLFFGFLRLSKKVWEFDILTSFLSCSFLKSSCKYSNMFFYIMLSILGSG